MSAEPLSTTTLVRLIREMGHDMRSVIGTLTATSDMLVAGVYGELTPKQARASARLQRNSNRLLVLLDDVMTYIKSEAGQYPLSPVTFAPRETLDDVNNTVRPIAETKGLNVQYQIDETVPNTLLGDEPAIQRIILALMWNAVAFTEKGVVTLESTWSEDEGWIIRICDQGPGISPEDTPHIYEPFWQHAQPRDVPTSGFGIGLAMAFTLAKLMAGRLHLENSGENGTTFDVFLPLKVADASHTTQPVRVDES
jgi:signal transduction histidine kinase